MSGDGVYHEWQRLPYLGKQQWKKPSTSSRKIVDESKEMLEIILWAKLEARRTEPSRREACHNINQSARHLEYFFDLQYVRICLMYS